MTNYEREWHRRCYEKAKLAYAALMKFYPLTLEDLPGEIWKPIPDWEDYHGSNFGRVKSFKYKTPRIIKPTIDQLGYLQITVSKGRKRKSVRIHQLVARTFIPNPENKPQVNHIDGNKLNSLAFVLQKLVRFNSAKRIKTRAALYVNQNLSACPTTSAPKSAPNIFMAQKISGAMV